MIEYTIEKSIFLCNKKKIDSLVFWREHNGVIIVRPAIPIEGLTKLLKTLENGSKQKAI